MKLRLVLFLCFLSTPFSHGQKSLSNTKVESVKFSQADLPLILDYLSITARERNAKPANFVIYDPTGELKKTDPKVTLSLSHIPLSVVLKYSTQLTRTGFHVDRGVVWIGRPKDLQVLRVRRKSRESAALAAPVFDRFKQIRVPEIDFSDIPLNQAVELLRVLDRSKGGAGNFLIIGSDAKDPEQTIIDLKARDISLAELIQYSSELSDFRLRADPRAVVFRASDARRQPIPIARGNLLAHLSRNINEVVVKDLSLAEMIEFIQYHSRTPNRPAGVNIISFSKTEKTVSLDLKSVRLIDVLRYTSELTQTTFRVDKNAIQLIDLPPLKRDSASNGLE